MVVWQGTLLALPYPDATFDVVWRANTVQYLDDTELAAARTELRRVIRLGGTVAVKDLDTHLITLRPGDPYLFTDFFRVAGAGPGYARRLLRFRELCHWMRWAGFTDVRQRTVLIEHHAPLTPSARAFCTAACARGPSGARPRAEPPVDGPARPGRRRARARRLRRLHQRGQRPGRGYRTGHHLP